MKKVKIITDGFGDKFAELTVTIQVHLGNGNVDENITAEEVLDKFRDDDPSDINEWVFNAAKASGIAMQNVDGKIDFTEFVSHADALEIKLGTIVTAERIPKNKKMLTLTVDFGNGDVRPVVTNIGSTYEPEFLVDMQMPFFTNLEPAVISNLPSEAMIIVSTDENKYPHLLNLNVTPNGLPNGSKLL